LWYVRSFSNPLSFYHDLSGIVLVWWIRVPRLHTANFGMTHPLFPNTAPSASPPSPQKLFLSHVWNYLLPPRRLLFPFLLDFFMSPAFAPALFSGRFLPFSLTQPSPPPMVTHSRTKDTQAREYSTYYHMRKTQVFFFLRRFSFVFFPSPFILPPSPQENHLPPRNKYPFSLLVSPLVVAYFFSDNFPSSFFFPFVSPSTLEFSGVWFCEVFV